MKRLTNPLMVPKTGEVLSYKLNPGVTDTKARTKLGELEDLEEQGRLFILPCPIGTPVFGIRKCLAPSCEVCRAYLFSETCRTEYKGKVIECKFVYSMIPEFGKNVFLTKEKAEAALEKMKGEEHE